MVSNGYFIRFNGFYAGQVYELESHANEYRNLMVLLKDKICPEDFGQCGGMGRCGTCMVKVPGLVDDTGISFRNEQATLAKMGITDPEIRLSCQVSITGDLNDLAVQILDNI